MYALTFGVPAAITRCGNFYGGGDLNWNRLMPGTIRSVLKGERPIIRSDGTLHRDFLYIEDGVTAYLTLAEALHARPELRGEAYNFFERTPPECARGYATDSGADGVTASSLMCAARRRTRSSTSG